MYKDGGSYESPSLYMGHVVERCADRSIGRLLQILYVVHVVLIPDFSCNQSIRAILNKMGIRTQRLDASL